MMQFATFWSGPLTPLEVACMLSFVDHGHTVTLFSFEKYDLPRAIEQKPAGEIADMQYLKRFRTGGRPNTAHFADFFRLLLFAKTNHVWVDCDVLCLQAAFQPLKDEIIVRESSGSIINCVLRITDKNLLEEATRLTESLLDKDVVWAATQNAIKRAINRTHYRGATAGAELFSPIHVNDWFKFLLPEYREDCLQLCANANTVHIYNNVLQKVGYLKSALPPRGSYLHELLKERQITSLFSGTYDEETVHALACNWELRFSGEDIGFGALARQTFPSLRRTMARRRFR